MTDTVSNDDLASSATVVEYCANNVSPETRDWLSESGVDARGLPCLERCGTCRRRAFLVVDGEVRAGESHEDLLGPLSEVAP